ncbi:MAG TPA: universal stress protein, partial [Humisphaera sp.]
KVTRVVREGQPQAEIVDAAREWGADLIVVGAHARGRLARFLVGSTAEWVVRHAHCPVTVVAHDPAAREPAPPTIDLPATVRDFERMVAH